jgi:DNA polymerase V
VAGRMLVFLHTNNHNSDPWHSAQHGGRIEPTADTGALIGEAVRMLRPLWRQGFRYSKAGVVLDDQRDTETEPRSLFPSRDPAKSARLMAVLDPVNARFGRGALRPLSTGLARPWSTRHARLSPRYTTRADDMRAQALPQLTRVVLQFGEGLQPLRLPPPRHDEIGGRHDEIVGPARRDRGPARRDRGPTGRDRGAGTTRSGAGTTRSHGASPRRSRRRVTEGCSCAASRTRRCCRTGTADRGATAGAVGGSISEVCGAGRTLPEFVAADRRVRGPRPPTRGRRGGGGRVGGGAAAPCTASFLKLLLGGVLAVASAKFLHNAARAARAFAPPRTSLYPTTHPYSASGTSGRRVA